MEELTATVIRLDKEVAVIHAEQRAQGATLDAQAVAFCELSREVRTMSNSMHTELNGMSKELTAYLLKAESARTNMMWSAILAGGGVFSTLLFWVFNQFSIVA